MLYHSTAVPHRYLTIDTYPRIFENGKFGAFLKELKYSSQTLC